MILYIARMRGAVTIALAASLTSACGKADADKAKMEGFKDRMCACAKDGDPRGCADKVSKDFEPWVKQERYKESAKGMDDLVGAYLECWGKATGAKGCAYVPGDSIETLMDCLTSAKPTEGDLQLDNIVGLAKRYYAHHGAFPSFTAPATPAAPCCAGPNQMCAPSAADWEVGAAAPTSWGVLGFEMTDRPYRFRYSYRGTATEFTATATADLDCDPSNGETTITAHGHVANGEPVVEITRTDEN